MKIGLNRPELVLGGFCAVLLTILLYECAASVAAFDPAPLHVHQPTFASHAISFLPPSAKDFAQIDARPLFNPSRKPIDTPQPSAGGGTSGDTLPAMTLVGVILDSQNKLALVKRPDTPFATSLALGTLVGAWQVTKISSDGVVLRNGLKEQTIRMSNTPSPVPARTLATILSTQRPTTPQPQNSATP